ncbi:MAG: DUF2231 domain-containing protein [Nodosilinea sp.]
MLDDLLPLNNHNLSGTIHPILVHFLIAMALFALVCDLMGTLANSPRHLEVSWWNRALATVSIFLFPSPHLP